MCVLSQYIPAQELWDGFSPSGFKEGIFVVFRGYIDESYGTEQDVFALSCLITKGKYWREMERAWKLHLNAKNKKLRKAGRQEVSRYHATDCNSRNGEFRGWEPPERDEFVLSLFEVFKMYPTNTSALDIRLKEACEVFPEWGADRLKIGYALLTMFLIDLIGRDFARTMPNSEAKVTLFHDQTASKGKYDPTILRMFNAQINDPAFAHKDMFTTIAPLRWQQSIALQPADLVAYECYRSAEMKAKDRSPRKSYQALIDMETFGIHYQHFGKEALITLRERLLQSYGVIQPLD